MRLSLLRSSVPEIYANRAYVCPTCRVSLRRRQLASSIAASDTRCGSFTSSPRTTRRTIHSSALRQNLEQRIQSPLQQDVPPNLSVPPGLQNGQPPNKGSGPPKSTIRDHFRAWSDQKLQDEKDQFPEMIRENTALNVLPDKFFEDDASDEYSEHLEEYNDSVEGQTGLRLFPGDLLVVDVPGLRKQFGYYLGCIDDQSQFCLADGRWAVGYATPNQYLVLRGRATPEEVERVRAFLPKKPVTRMTALGISEMVTYAESLPQVAVAPLVSKIEKILADAVSFRRDNISAIDQVYDLAANEKLYNVLTFRKLVRMLFDVELSSLSDGALVAIHHALRATPSLITLEKRLPEEIQVTFIPKRIARQSEQVIEWAREYQECAAQAAKGQDISARLQPNPLNAFVAKARRLILQSRKTRAPTTLGVLGPSSKKAQKVGEVELQKSGETFSANDKMILEFLWDTFLRLPKNGNPSRFQSICSLIMRAIGAYPNMRLNRGIGRLLLQELGALAPWAEQTDDSVALPIPGRIGAHVADQLWEKSEELATEMGFSRETSSNVSVLDTMADLRKDWGDTEIFLIDRPSTSILDDGISLESVSEIPGAYWVHIHVAHPAAFFEPQSVLGRRADHFSHSVYTSRGQYPMLPFSVAETLSLGQGKPVMTISSLILPDGELKDVKITLGIVHNTIRLDPDAVDDMLGVKRDESVVLIVGPDTFKSNEISEESLQAARRHEPTLKILQRIAHARTLHRRLQVPEYANWIYEKSRVWASVSTLEDYDASRLLDSYHYIGDPSIKLVGSEHPVICAMGESYLATGLTDSMMVLAGEAAGRWLRERDVPAIFNGALAHPEYPVSRLNRAGMNEIIQPPRARLYSSPKPHLHMNVQAYARLTSPLRRYTDLLAQWQIGAYLRAEAEGRLSNGVDKIPPNTLPFSHEDLEECVLVQEAKLGRLEPMPTKVSVHWALQAMFRAFHFKEASLPEVWDVQITGIGPSPHPTVSKLTGMVWPFRLKAQILKTEERFEDQCLYRQFLPCKIELVNVTTGIIDVRPIGPPSDLMTQKPPKHIVSQTSS